MGQGEHPPPLAEDDDLPPLLEHDLPHELAQLDQLGRGQALEHAFLRGASREIVGQIPSNWS